MSLVFLLGYRAFLPHFYVSNYKRKRKNETDFACESSSEEFGTDIINWSARVADKQGPT